MVSTSQPRNRLENGRGKNDKMPGQMRQTVETNIRKVRMAETEGGRSKGRGRKETRRERKKK